MLQMLLGFPVQTTDQIIDQVNHQNLQLKNFLAVQEMTLMLYSIIWALLQHQEVQACYKEPRTVRAVQIKEQQQGSVQTELDSFCKPA